MSTTTEFICEVVRVTGFKPHPNADKLEIATISSKDGPMAYEVVVRKGDYREGELAGYVGVDSLIPRGRDERFNFLFERPDGQSKQVFRLRAARLRGVYSEGLLVKSDPKLDTGFQLGSDLSEYWGITKYEPPVRGVPTPGNPNPAKDQTLGGKFPIYAIDSLKKVPWLFGEHEYVVATEKIHGTNLRAGWVKQGLRYQFVYGSHRVIKTDLRGFWRRLWDKLRGRGGQGPGWYGDDIWAKAVKRHQLEEALSDWQGIVCYFELFGVTDDGKRIQDLTYGDVKLGLRLIDAYDSVVNMWLTFEDRQLLAQSIGVPMVPALADGRYGDLNQWKGLAEGESTIAPGQVREGIVLHSYNGTGRGKYVGQGYLMRKDG